MRIGIINSLTMYIRTNALLALRIIISYHLAMDSLVEGGEQLDLPKSQTTTELCHACVVYIFRVYHKHNRFLLGPIQPSSPTT